MEIEFFEQDVGTMESIRCITFCCMMMSYACNAMSIKIKTYGIMIGETSIGFCPFCGESVKSVIKKHNKGA